MSILIYIGFAWRKDAALAQELEDQFAPLEQLEPPLIRWSERNISVGSATKRESEEHLDRARIIVLVVTATFLAQT